MTDWDLGDLINDAVDDGRGEPSPPKAEVVTTDEWGLGDLISDGPAESEKPVPAESVVTDDELGLGDLLNDLMDGEKPYVKPVWCGCWKDDCEACEVWLQSCLF